MARENPYKPGGPCYLAYEAGYADAILDAMEMMGGCEIHVKRNHAAGDAAGLSGNDENASESRKRGQKRDHSD